MEMRDIATSHESPPYRKAAGLLLLKPECQRLRQVLDPLFSAEQVGTGERPSHMRSASHAPETNAGMAKASFASSRMEKL
ncbi:hypothetical protein MesoLj131b_73310 (plasmid) [Mesorhizobium sp. 131-2-5]|nr:hypothetical protein MesoLj131b_73310 [Mesorhizobium sp. 131-2-5]